MKESKISNSKKTVGTQCHSTETQSYFTHKSDEMKTEMPNIVDKKFQTLIKACLGMCINSNLHLEMFHI